MPAGIWDKATRGPREDRAGWFVGVSGEGCSRYSVAALGDEIEGLCLGQ